MPLCRDCAHCAPDHDALTDPYLNAKCLRSETAFESRVSGATLAVTCSVERSFGTACGPDGKLFEPDDVRHDATVGATAMGG